MFGKKSNEKSREERNIAHTGGEDVRSDDPGRVKTGIPRLDHILKGGFLRGGTYVVFGPPGCGKTILGNQICFNFVDMHGARCAYLTLLTESHGKLISHLRSMRFFKEEPIATQAIHHVSGFRVLEKEGAGGLLNLVRDTLHSTRAKFLVVDGLESIVASSKTEPEFKKFVHELMLLTSVYECTTLLCAAESGMHPRSEATVVDGVFELSLKLHGPRALRELTVHKFRGSDFLQGRHEVEITDKGLQIHPRTEIQFDKPPGNACEERIRMPFGVKSLDHMLHGGPFSGSSTAIIGAPGTGKTSFGISYLVEGARQGHPGVYFGFYEPPPRLIEKATAIGIELEKYVQNGMIEIMWQPPLEQYLDSLAEQLLEKLRAEQLDQSRRRRLFIDSLAGFWSATAYDERIGRFLSAFTNQLRMLDITSLISDDLSLFKPEIEVRNPELTSVCETVILLRTVELRSQLHRLVSIMKMRESDYDSSIREFRITKKGIEVASSFESAEQILSGQARTVRREPNA